MEETIRYYNENAKAFCSNTRDVVFTETQDKFLSYLQKGDRILDFGCGSGRDTKYFLEKGFVVDATDGSEELVKIASEYAQTEVWQMLFQELDAEAVYDGIWACSSILHLTRTDLIDVFGKIARALVSRGVLYTSFKYGTEEVVKNGRFFIDMTEHTMEAMLNEIDLFVTEDMWVTSDARPGREDEKWLNIIGRKKM